MDYRNIKEEIQDLVDLTRRLQGNPAGAVDRLEAEHRKWSLIHQYVRTRPFREPRRIPRSQQWRLALAKVRDLQEPELIDWLCLQVDVATNIEKGIRDMRPRRGGTCHSALLIYLQDREHKAGVVLNWNQSCDVDLVDLTAPPSSVFRSGKRAAPKMDNPLHRSGSLWQEPKKDN